MTVKENMCFRSTICELGIPEERICENVIELFSKTDEFDIMYRTIKAGLLRKKYSLQSIREIMYSLDEAFANAIMWGNKNDVNKKVTVKYYICRNFCAISIRDQGDGFNVYDMVKTLDRDTKTAVTVRGLYSIKKYADLVFFNEKGNNIMMIKYNDDVEKIQILLK